MDTKWMDGANMRNSAILAGTLLLAMAAVTRPATAQQRGIADFVRQIYIHGVPYNLAVEYDATNVPQLLKMLADTEEEQYWPNIVVTIGMIGDERAVEPLLEFFYSGEGKLSDAEYAAKTSVLFALGYLANRMEGDEPLRYLMGGVNPTNWQRRDLGWLAPFQESPQDRDEQLSSLAIIGLALSGRPEARDVLLRLRETAGEEGQEMFRESVRDLIDTALRDHETIAREGLGAYYRQEQGPGPGGPDVILGAEAPPPVVTGRDTAPELPGRAAGAAPRLPPRPALEAAPAIPEPAMEVPLEVREDRSDPESEGDDS